MNWKSRTIQLKKKTKVFYFNGFSLLRTQSVRNNKPFAMRMENNMRYITALALDSDD